jgi:hypothetical protein
MRSIEIPLHLSLANSLYTQTALNGGYTIAPDFKSPTKGYLVSVLDGLVFDSISEVNVHTLSTFIHENLNKVDIFFGGWIDQETKKVYFDLSVCLPQLDLALHIAKGKNQLAIWDLNEGREVRV